MQKPICFSNSQPLSYVMSSISPMGLAALTFYYPVTGGEVVHDEVHYNIACIHLFLILEGAWLFADRV